MIDNEPYWTLAEAVVWICTRDLTRVSSIGDIRSDAALAEETYKLLSEKIRTVVDPPDLNEIRDGAPKASWNVSGSADDQIIGRARDGNVRAIGRRKWEGPLERIPPAEFIGLRILTIPDGLHRGQSIDWLDVQFRRADVMQQWPSGLAMAPALETQDGESTVEQDESNLPVDTDPAPHVSPEQPDIGGNDQRETQRERSAGSGARSKTRGKPGRRVGKYHKPMCAALDNLCSNHGLDKVADWDWTHLRQRIERHPLFKGGYTLPEDSQFRKVCNEWFDKAGESGKYQNASR